MKSALPMAVVVPNWNLAADTVECVRSLLAAGYGLPVQIIVVDNGSTDGSPALLSREFGQSIELLSLPSNRGFAAAVNAGVRHALAAGAASVLVLNNDTIVAPDMLTLLCDAAPAADIVGPAIYYHGAPDRLWRLGDRASRWLPVPRRVPDRLSGERAVPVDYLTGCAMLVGREVFEGIGLFDESYFMYYEDADFCRRARDRGFTLLAVPAARMWHKVSLTARADPRANGYWRARAHVLFYRRHTSGAARAAVYPYLLAKSFAAAGRLLRSEGAAGAAAVLRGAWAGCVAPTEGGTGADRLAVP